MSWMLSLVNLYDNIMNAYKTAGEPLPENFCPMYHESRVASGIVTLQEVKDKQGRAWKAVDYEVFGKKDDANRNTVIPVTNVSRRRGSNVAPHPVFDTLKYIEKGDCLVQTFLSESWEKRTQKIDELSTRDVAKWYLSYINQLKEWVDSKDAHPLCEAVYEYITTHSVQDDIFALMPDDKTAEEKAKDVKEIILFRAIYMDGVVYEPWDDSLRESYERYYTSTENIERMLKEKKPSIKMSTCCITGDVNVPCVRLFPTRLRSSADNAALFSSNDPTQCSIEGRYTCSEDIAPISMDVAEKAFSALRYLARSTKCLRYEGLCILVWSDKVLDNSVFDDDDFEWDDNEETLVIRQMEEYQKKMAAAKNYLRGQSANTNMFENEDIHILILKPSDDGDTGRLAMVHYDTLSLSEYKRRMDEWSRDSLYIAPRFEEVVQEDGTTVLEKKMVQVRASVVQLVNAIYPPMASNKGVRKQLFFEFAKGIYGYGGRISYDIVHTAFENALRELCGYCSEKDIKKYRFNDMACILIKKFLRKEKGRDYTMGLDITCTNNSYLLGRWIALADDLEKTALYYGKRDRSETAAMRNMQAFCQSPGRTMSMIQMHLTPYITQLRERGLIHYERELAEVTTMMNTEAIRKMRHVEPDFTIGYNHQKAENRRWRSKAAKKSTKIEASASENTSKKVKTA